MAKKSPNQKNRSGKTYIEYGYSSNEEGGGCHLIVESHSPEASEQIFNRLYKKFPLSADKKPSRSMEVA